LLVPWTVAVNVADCPACKLAEVGLREIVMFRGEKPLVVEGAEGWLPEEGAEGAGGAGGAYPGSKFISATKNDPEPVCAKMNAAFGLETYGAVYSPFGVIVPPPIYGITLQLTFV
jgi:hypothetical protein